MEKKERYVIRYDLDYNQCLIDTEENQGVGDYIQIVKLLNQQSKQIKELEKQLAESEKNIEHYHKLYNERDKQFQSVRQRYHLLNKLQSNYDKKDKLHLAYMQCKELVDENEKLKQQLHDLPKKIVGDIEKNFTEYLPLKYKTGAGFYSRLNTILKKYGWENE